MTVHHSRLLATSRVMTTGSILVAATLAVGCSAVAEQASETALESLASADGEDVDIDLSGGAFDVEDDEGNRMSMDTGGTIPTSMTDTMAIPDGFEAVTSFEGDEAGRSGIIVSGRLTSGDAAGFLDELESNATDDGWTTRQRTGGDGPMHQVMMERGEEQVIASVVDEGDEPAATIFLSGAA